MKELLHYYLLLQQEMTRNHNSKMTSIIVPKDMLTRYFGKEAWKKEFSSIEELIPYLNKEQFFKDLNLIISDEV